MADSNKRVLMMTDGGKKVGMGHIMRSLSIAHILRGRGFEVSFMVNNESAAIDAVTSKGFKTVTNESSSQDLRNFREYDAVVFDTKRDISKEVRYFKDHGVKNILIDNLSSPAHHADCVIIPSLLKKGGTGMPADKHIFEGIQYFPLNHEFIRAGEMSKIRRDPKLRILVSMGGADPNNLTIKVVKALVNTAGIEMKVVVGPSMSESEQLLQLIDNDRLVFGADVKKMASLMLDTDIAFSALGITLYELAYTGVPSIVIANYREDKDDMAAFEKRGAGIPLGYYEEVTDVDIKKTVALFLQKEGLLENMSRNGRNLIDGKGTERIVQVIEELCGIKRKVAS